MRIHRFLAVACILVVTRARGDRLGGTLGKIKESATISLGHRESSIPYSYCDDRQQVVGYSHELALLAVEAVKEELKLPVLNVKLTPVTSQNRILGAALRTGCRP